MVGELRNPRPARVLNSAEIKSGPVIYWMRRDQRVHDNWALLFSQEQALKQGAPLLVVFCLVPRFLNAALKQYSFMIQGLQELPRNLAAQNSSGLAGISGRFPTPGQASPGLG
ncbi:MAG: deoxyribodipyrimidine photo-lyase [Deltaproteobacteria bacterium]|nr:deoxyribodipyrimidine photo-lyase [Deltaproteobacteria bacterium]MBW1952552.1 deoxyribodipyrimidine photo-lyase [Deltaproteobacteria bacterium]MBW1986115.1 deoxyribodipyrimidine photo-lyase [Deltaproteobacteria bacterium]MBW2134199.1 deoxyribodipyrimidine photo-lyase [Deltaproteobacteria bacterium]